MSLSVDSDVDVVSVVESHCVTDVDVCFDCFCCFGCWSLAAATVILMMGVRWTSFRARRSRREASREANRE